MGLENLVSLNSAPLAFIATEAFIEPLAPQDKPVARPATTPGTKPFNGGSVDVKAGPKDTEETVVRRALYSFARSAGLSSASSQEFAASWIEQLKKGATDGRIHLYQGKQRISAAAFAADKKDGTVSVTLEPGRHDSIINDLRQRQVKENLAARNGNANNGGPSRADIEAKLPRTGQTKPAAPTQGADNLISIAEMSTPEKLGIALQKAIEHLGPEVGERLKALLEPQSLAIMAGSVAALVAAQFVPVLDVVVDGILLGAGLFFLGKDAISVGGDLIEFAKGVMNAKNEADLDKAGQHLASAVATVGVDAVTAFLFHKTSGAIKKSGAGFESVGNVKVPGANRTIEIRAPRQMAEPLRARIAGEGGKPLPAEAQQARQAALKRQGAEEAAFKEAEAMRANLRPEAQKAFDQIRAESPTDAAFLAKANKGGNPTRFFEAQATRAQTEAANRRATGNRRAQALKQLDTPEFRNNQKAQDAIKTKNEQVVTSEISTEIARQQLAQQYPKRDGYEIQSEIKVFQDTGFASRKAWQDANPGKPAESVIEADGKVWGRVTDIDLAVAKKNADGKYEFVELEQVKSGQRDSGAQAKAQNTKAVDAVEQKLAGGPAVRLEINGKDVTALYDLPSMKTGKSVSRGPQGKAGFDQSLGLTAQDMKVIAERLMTQKPITNRVLLPINTNRDQRQ
jgi:hypothetical protein